jgi:hypothetical protein
MMIIEWKFFMGGGEVIGHTISRSHLCEGRRPHKSQHHHKEYVPSLVRGERPNSTKLQAVPVFCVLCFIYDLSLSIGGEMTFAKIQDVESLYE